jgi:hypothetical protein
MTMTMSTMVVVVVVVMMMTILITAHPGTFLKNHAYMYYNLSIDRIVKHI